MKRILLIAATAFLFYQAGAQATIDRTKRPVAGPAPVITLKDPVTYKMPNGITVLIVEDHRLPRVTANYYIDAGPVTEGKKAGVQSLMGQMLREGTTDMPKAQFDEAVDRIGATLSLSSGGGNVSALTRYFSPAFELMGKAMKSPAMMEESFRKLQTQVLTGLKAGEKNVNVVSARVVNALSYGTQHPLGEFETEETVKNLTLNDVKSAYRNYITPSRSYLTIIGDITPDAAKQEAQKVFGNFTGSQLALPALAPVSNVAKTEIDVVDMSNAVQSEITVGNLVDLKMNDPDYFPVLLANEVLGGGADSRLFTNLREKHGFTYGAYSEVEAGRFQNLFTSSAAVRTAKTDSAVTEFISEIERLRTQKITAEELANAKALYNGSFALGLEEPARVATFARNILLNDLPRDFYKTYLQKINAVTVDDVQRVAQKYFNSSNTRVIIVGNAAQMQEGLAKLTYPVKMYDRYANPVTASKPAAAVNVQAADVLSGYIKAIGGMDEIGKVKSILVNAGAQMQGMNIQMQMKAMLPNMKYTTMTMGSNVLMKSSFDGTTGYQQQMGNKKAMSDDEIKEARLFTGLFEQVDYLKNAAFKTAVKGVEKVNGADAYKLAITYPDSTVKTEYYDVASKLLVKKEYVRTANSITANTTEEYSDYKKAGAILFPFTQVLTVSANGRQQVLETKTTEIKINEGITAADFK